MSPSASGWAQEIAGGDKAAVARALNLVEDRRAQAQASIEALLQALVRCPDRAHRIGLTGPPGVGKSTLTAALARELRRRDRSGGVLAVDPSSVRSGGALLGDRARMGFDPQDRGLFVRSLATGGEAGGLAYAANAAVEVLAAAYDVVLVETTGVGQTETDVEHVVDTVALVVQPGSGDVLQFIKAGIMEIPDLLVVNKGDQRKLAQRARGDLEAALDTLRAVGVGRTADAWEVPVLVTSARDGTGIGALVDAFDRHLQSFAPGTLAAHRRAGAAAWCLSLFVRRHGEHGLEQLGGRAALLQRIQAQLENHETTAVSVSAGLGRRYLEALRGP